MRFILTFILFSTPVIAKEITTYELKERFTIDSKKPTLLIFPELAQLSLTSPALELIPFAESGDSNIWKATPNCDSNCQDTDLEFVMASGRHITIKLKISEGIKDHVLILKDLPTLGTVEATRIKLIPLARQIFLQVVRNWPALPKTEEIPPDNIKSFANHWQAFKTDHFIIFTGQALSLKKQDVESLKDPAIILIGFYDDSIAVIKRRKL